MFLNLNTRMSKEQKIENDKAGILKKCFFFSLSNSAELYQELIFPSSFSHWRWQGGKKEYLWESISNRILEISSNLFFLGSQRYILQPVRRHLNISTRVVMPELVGAIVLCQVKFLDGYLWDLCLCFSMEDMVEARCGKRRQQLWQCQPGGQVIIVLCRLFSFRSEQAPLYRAMRAPWLH